jgi:hypothetical protein
MAIFHSPVASGLRTKVGAVFAQAIVIARLAQWYVMRKAGPTLPRYGSDLVANAFGFIANTFDLRTDPALPKL